VPALTYAVESEHPLIPKGLGLARTQTSVVSSLRKLHSTSSRNAFSTTDATYVALTELTDFQKHLHLPQSSEQEAFGSPVINCPELAIDVCASDVHHVKLRIDDLNVVLVLSDVSMVCIAGRG